MQVPRWRNVLILKNILFPTLSQSSINAHFASFHSTSSTCEKWKNKWNADVKSFNNQPKNYARYAVRQRRADAKKALKDLLYRTGCTKTSLEDEDRIWSLGGGRSNDAGKKKKSRSFAQQGSKSHYKKMKRKFRRDSFPEDIDEPETLFQATFGNRWYTWSFKGSFQGSTFGFEWREQPNGPKFNSREWHRNETESEDECCSVGSCSDRTILGLPPTGPLKIDDVKNAFRISALKWHPDKHQGPSQATAEEKFKLCVNAYKSLCDALS